MAREGEATMKDKRRAQAKRQRAALIAQNRTGGVVGHRDSK
jgi:hypothetical protein